MKATRTWTFCSNAVIPAPRRTLLGTEQAITICAMRFNKAFVTQEIKEQFVKPNILVQQVAAKGL